VNARGGGRSRSAELGNLTVDGLDSSSTLSTSSRALPDRRVVVPAVAVFTVVDEMVFQLRHGMPSARRRRLVGLSPFARRRRRC
jgi:hypothetical protein